MDDQRKETTTENCEEWFQLTMTEVTYSFGVDDKTIQKIIDEGIINVEHDVNDQLQFNNEAIQRIKTVLRLHRDLGVNIAGAGLAIELMKRIEALEARLRQQRRSLQE